MKNNNFKSKIFFFLLLTVSISYAPYITHAQTISAPSTPFFTRSYNGATSGNQNRQWMWQPAPGEVVDRYLVTPSWSAPFYTTSNSFKISENSNLATIWNNLGTAILKDDQTYTLKVQAVNSAGISPPATDSIHINYQNPSGDDMGNGTLVGYFPPGTEPTNVTKIKYNVRIESGEPKVFFLGNGLTGPSGSQYAIEVDLFHQFLYSDPACERNTNFLIPTPGVTQVNNVNGISVDVSDYAVPRGKVGFKTLSPSVFPRLLDNGVDSSPVLVNGFPSSRSEFSSQVDIKNKDIIVEIDKGSIITNKSGWKCDGSLLDSDTYREWDATITIGGTPYQMAFALPDSWAEYLNPQGLFGPSVEFFEFPGVLKYNFWGVQFQRENSTTWEDITKFQVGVNPYNVTYPVDYGFRISSYYGHNVLEISNDAPNAYYAQNDILDMNVIGPTPQVPDLTPPSSTSSVVSITYLSPSFGSLGTAVTISGTGFTSTNNTVIFGSTQIAHIPSSDGTTLHFVVPSSGVSVGANNVSVQNDNGISNRVTFTSQATFDFSLGYPPITLSVVQGGSVSRTITASLVSGDSRSINLSTSLLDSTSSYGLTWGMNPITCTPTCSSVLTVLTSSSTAPGFYRFTTYAVYNGSVSGIMHSQTFLLDVLPLPSVSVSSPTTGNLLSGTTTITAAYSGGIGIAGVQFLLDGNPIGAEDTIAPYSYVWDTKLTANGDHALSARARDFTGKTFTSSSSVRVLIQNIVSTKFSINDPVITKYNILALSSVSPLATSTIVNINSTGTVIGGPVYKNVFMWQIRWANGIVGWSPESYLSKRDITPPSVVILSPVSTPVANSIISSTLALSTSASDDVRVSGVKFYVDGTQVGTEDTLAPYSIFWDSRTVANGPHTLSASARDSSGNLATSSTTYFTVQNKLSTKFSLSDQMYAISSVNSRIAPSLYATTSAVLIAPKTRGIVIDGPRFNQNYWWWKITWDTGITGWSAENYLGKIDLTPPTISLQTISQSVSGTMPLIANASDNVRVAGVQFILDGKNLGIEDLYAPYVYSWNTRYISNGTHNISVRARDTSGNITTTLPTPITVSNLISTKFSIGDKVLSRAGTYVRSGPSTASSSVATTTLNQQGVVVGGPVYSPGYWWWQVTWNTSGLTGWSTESYITKQ